MHEISSPAFPCTAGKSKGNQQASSGGERPKNLPEKKKESKNRAWQVVEKGKPISINDRGASQERQKSNNVTEAGCRGGKEKACNLEKNSEPFTRGKVS